MKIKKKILPIFIVVAMLLTLCMALCACDKEEEEVKHGITITTTEKQAIVSSGFDAAVYNIMKGVVLKYTDLQLNTVEWRIQGLARKADTLLRDAKISEEEYVSLRDDLKQNETVYVEAIYSASKGNGDFSPLKPMLLKLSSILGNRGLSDFTYGLILENLYLSYTDYYNTEDHRQSKLDELQSDWEAFGAITREDFCSVFSFLLLGIDLATEEVDVSGFTLTNSEMASLFKKIDLSNQIDTNGWKIILKMAGQFLDSDSFFGEVYETVMANTNTTRDDLGAFASSMPIAFELICSIQQKLDGEMVGLLKTDEFAFFDRVRSVLTEEEWTKIETMVSIDINKYSYYAIGYSQFGQDFVSYNTSVKKYGVSDLRTCTSEEVSEVLEGIVASISPVFSYYGWHYDRG